MKTPKIIPSLFVLISLLLPAVISYAKPISVELYPNSAKLTERATVPVEQAGNRFFVRLTLPAHAVTDSLTINPAIESGMIITSVQTQLQTIEETGKLGELKNKLKDLQRRKADLDARIKANTAYISFWENASKNLPEKTESVEKLAGEVRKGIADADYKIFKFNQDLEPLNEEIKDLEKQIDKMTGQAKKQWQVTAYLNKKTTDKIDLIYSYYTGNCNWEPIYTLNAHPDKSEIEFDWYADITQNTGVNWDNVNLTLATAQAHPQPEPPVLGEWIIQPVQIYPIHKMTSVSDMARIGARLNEAKERELPELAPQPEQKHRYLFDTYNLGKQTIPAGETRRMDIREKTWKADFKYLIRPYESRQAFLFAQTEKYTEENKVPQLPQGMATFLIDSSVVATRPFSMFDEKEKLFFGSDPQVGVKMDVVSKKSGEKGLFAGKKTYQWGWKVTVNNLKSHDIAVVMEDAYPQLRDARIKLEESFSGVTPEKDKNLLKWEFSVKPRTQTVVEYGFLITYPDDLNLTFGGR